MTTEFWWVNLLESVQLEDSERAGGTDNLNMCLEETRCEDVNWTELTPGPCLVVLSIQVLSLNRQLISHLLSFSYHMTVSQRHRKRKQTSTDKTKKCKKIGS